MKQRLIEFIFRKNKRKPDKNKELKNKLVYNGFGLSVSKTEGEKAVGVADTILEDLSKLTGPQRMLLFRALEERRKVWKEKGILINGGCPEIMEPQNCIAMGMDH